MKYSYIIEDSINGTDIYCRAYPKDQPNTEPLDMIHSPNLDEILAWIRVKEMEP